MAYSHPFNYIVLIACLGLARVKLVAPVEASSVNMTEYTQELPDRFDVYEADDIFASLDGAFAQILTDNEDQFTSTNFSVKSLIVNARDSGHNVNGEPPSLETSWLRIPDVTDKLTILSFARMAASAYVRDPKSEKWVDVGGAWDRSKGIGWDSDGLRGHIFVDKTMSVVVIALKGTTTFLAVDESDTYENDRINDNLLFSCCCGRANAIKDPVCDCCQSMYTCSGACLNNELDSKDRYYRAALVIYNHVVSLYPRSNIWITGHSMAASLGSLLAQNTGLPAVTFSAPGDKLAAKRLHLPSPLFPDSEKYIWHFGNTADPLYMGICNGYLSPCYLAGYAMESQCHSGLECTYDTVHDKEYSVSLIYHQIERFIEIIEDYDRVASCTEPVSCLDCYLWNFPNESVSV